jgi:hypothetical protein
MSLARDQQKGSRRIEVNWADLGERDGGHDGANEKTEKEHLKYF